MMIVSELISIHSQETCTVVKAGVNKNISIISGGCENTLKWWQGTTFYEINVLSFKDGKRFVTSKSEE